jgi:hypothetical protein
LDEPTTVGEWSLLPWRSRRPQQATEAEELEEQEPLSRAA